MTAPIPFIDLQAQRRRIEPELRRRLDRVLEHGRFIMGPEVGELEGALAAYTGAQHVVTCANGTDALVLTFMALGLGPGDAVVVPAFTFTATAEAVAVVGATPVFADVDPSSFNLAVDELDRAVAAAERDGLRARAVVPVDLFGQPADYATIEPVAAELGLFVVADAAQSAGATRDGRKVGTLGGATTTSFFPSKPLGCYGDGGAVLTDDDDLAAVLRSLRMHGARAGDKNDNERIGLNSRLDTLQAAVLLAKLTVFDDELERRNAVADRYAEQLAGTVAVPQLDPGATSVWAQYTIRTGDRDGLAAELRTGDRDGLAAELRSAGIPTAVYYPRPLHHQTAYRDWPAASDLPVSTAAAETVISLPMHPYLDAEVQDRIVAGVRAWAGRAASPVPA